QIAALLKRLVTKLGMPYVNMRLIKNSLREGLWREIVQQWIDVALANTGYIPPTYPLVDATPVLGDPFAYIKVSPLNVRPPVRDTGDDPFMGGRITNVEQGVEPQGS